MLKQNSLLKNNLLLGMLFLLSILLSACGGKKNLNMGKYKPALNKNPKYYFIIKGHVAHNLVQHVNLFWKVNYYSSTKKCDVIYNSLEGISGPRITTEKYHAKIDANGKYEIKIPIDKYDKGYCKWQIAAIESTYGYSFQHLSSFVVFGQPGSCSLCDIIFLLSRHASNGTIKFDNYCRLSKAGTLVCQTRSDDEGYFMSNKLSNSRNYMFFSNYYYQQG